MIPLRGRAGEVWAFDLNQPSRVACPAVVSLTASATLPLLLMTFPAPHSYTGEDSLELVFAGNPHVADRILAVLTSLPCVRLAHPGEFTARAFLNRRLSLDQAEGVAAAIAARTDEQLAAAQQLLAGTTGAMYRHWADDCATLLALVEAGIDFTDQEDVVAITSRDLAARAGGLADALDAHIGVRAGDESRGSLPTVAIAGAPNAGKSTLFNALLARERAVTSPTAGTTRDVLREELDLSRDVPGAGSVVLMDLAGLSETPQGVIDAAAQDLARGMVARADVVLWCDPSGAFRETESPAALRVKGENGHAQAIIRVRTFGDQPAAGVDESTISVCALDRWNLGALRRAIADHACAASAAGVAAILPRHRRCLTAARDALRAAAVCAQTPELAATNLRTALDELSQLVGAISPDDIIGRVFSLFCVGK